MGRESNREGEREREERIIINFLLLLACTKLLSRPSVYSGAITNEQKVEPLKWLALFEVIFVLALG